MTDTMQCPDCEGQGAHIVREQTGEVSREMARDGCDMSLEGQPIFENVQQPCERCGGGGVIEAAPRRVVRSFKASPVSASKPVLSLELVFDDETPDIRVDSEWEQRWRTQYEEESNAIEVALFETLPGGLYDQILRAMLARKASLLKISHKD
jgi:hypothetical protein